jgi:uncharacterized protein YecT (DUF1311 family)
MNIAYSLISLVIFPCLAFADATWSWTKPVYYKEQHDPSVIWLKENLNLRVEFSKEISFEDVEKWPKGKALLLVFKQGDGVKLLDPANGKSLAVFSGLPSHPIEQLLAACIEKDQTTLGMVACRQKALEAWDKELNRLYTRLSGLLNAEQKQEFKEAQRNWMTYRDSQIKAMAGLYAAKSGSINKLIAAEKYKDITRHQAELLNELLASQLDLQ